MMNSDLCVDCGDPGAKYFDPRDESLPEDLLCVGCLKEATRDRVNELVFEISVLKEALRVATRDS